MDWLIGKPYGVVVDPRHQINVNNSVVQDLRPIRPGFVLHLENGCQLGQVVVPIGGLQSSLTPLSCAYCGLFPGQGHKCANCGAPKP